VPPLSRQAAPRTHSEINPWFQGFSVVSFVVETWLSVRQHRCFHVRTVPAEVASAVKQEVFDKSQKYGLTRRLPPFSFPATPTIFFFFAAPDRAARNATIVCVPQFVRLRGIDHHVRAQPGPHGLRRHALGTGCRVC
jgi:hypothetical protein